MSISKRYVDYVDLVVLPFVLRTQNARLGVVRTTARTLCSLCSRSAWGSTAIPSHFPDHVENIRQVDDVDVQPIHGIHCGQ